MTQDKRNPASLGAGRVGHVQSFADARIPASIARPLTSLNPWSPSRPSNVRTA